MKRSDLNAMQDALALVTATLDKTNTIEIATSLNLDQSVLIHGLVLLNGSQLQAIATLTGNPVEDVLRDLAVQVSDLEAGLTDDD